MYIYIYICIWVSVCACTCAYAFYVCEYKYLNICGKVHIYIYIYIYICECVYLYLCVQVIIYIYIYIYIYSGCMCIFIQGYSYDNVIDKWGYFNAHSTCPPGSLRKYHHVRKPNKALINSDCFLALPYCANEPFPWFGRILLALFVFTLRRTITHRKGLLFKNVTNKQYQISFGWHPRPS